MTKYLISRIIRGLLSVIAVVMIVMILVYTFSDRDRIFLGDPDFSRKQNNDQEIYKYQKWEEYGYLDYVRYADYLNQLTADGELAEEDRASATVIGRKPDADSELTKEYVQKFTEHYQSEGYTVVRLDAKLFGARVAPGGNQQLFAYKNTPVFVRMFKFFGEIIHIDNIHYVKDDIEDRGISFTLYDPVYNTEPGTGEITNKVFSPAIIGNGTQHKYLLYFDGNFPFIHQNLITFRLGKSYSVKKGVDVLTTMTEPMGYDVFTMMTFPTGAYEKGSKNLHTAKYGGPDTAYYVDNYTNVSDFKTHSPRIVLSFLTGLMASIAAYLLAIPMGIAMARKKDKLIDKLGTLYIIFIMACPSLAYILMLKELGRATKVIPTAWSVDTTSVLVYVLPIVSLAMPSIAGLMKWLRRYMIDQMNSDYVKFARSGGLSENEIFKKHIFKNAAIPIIHGIPGSVLGSLVGAIITERVYSIPGVGGLLTDAISLYDNGVIIGLTLFYALISIISIILGDMLMAIADPRISFNSKAR